jgi:2-iminobutanoate/2-iminopropanoate deaminase
MDRTPLFRLTVGVALTFATACSPASPPPQSAEAATAAQATATQTPAPAQRRVISTPDAPAAIGPYSQAIQVGSTLYLAGQIALDPVSGDLVEGGIQAETRRVMENLGAVLEAAGFAFGDVVQSQVFLTNLDDFGAMNGVYEGYFGQGAPARATVGVAALPRGARVEILMTAAR